VYPVFKVGYILARCPVLPDHFNILDEQRRYNFLSATRSLIEKGTTLDKWAISSLELDASGRVSPNPELRAVNELVAITFVRQPNPEVEPSKSKSVV
jgi:hypothetical protein